jgi:hypothetical protein
VRLPKVVHKLNVKISKHFKLKQLGLIDVFVDGIWELNLPFFIVSIYPLYLVVSFNNQ